MDNDIRIRFMTKDKNLVMNRLSNSGSFYGAYRSWKNPDLEWIRKLLEYDARQKGVKIVNLSCFEDRIEAIVEWL